MGTKISALPNSTALTGAELIPVVQGGVTKHATLSSVAFTGGSSVDGSLSQSSVLSNVGYYDFDSMNVSAPLSIPPATIIRINGDATLSSTLTVNMRTLLSSISASYENSMIELMGGIFGNDGEVAGSIGGGGGSIGAGTAGGSGAGGAAKDISAMFRAFASKSHGMLLGGNGGGGSNGASGGDFGRGGGALVLIVDGNCNFTGGTITANGGMNNNLGPGGATPGGGAGGSITIICTGTLTGGTFTTTAGYNSNINAGAGAGGFIQLVASAFAGTQTTSVVGALSAGAGAVKTYGGLTASQIRRLIQR